MSEQNLKEGSFKQKIIHELKTVGWLSLYLALFFCALCTYSMLMLHELNVTNSYFLYGFAIIKALVKAKIILIGEYARLGRGHENKPLIISALWKAFSIRLACGSLSYCPRNVSQLWASYAAKSWAMDARAWPCRCHRSSDIGERRCGLPACWRACQGWHVQHPAHLHVVARPHWKPDH